MANSLVKKIELDSNRRVVLRVTGVLDTSNVDSTPILTTAQVPYVGRDNLTVSGFRVASIKYSGPTGLLVNLAFNSGSPETFAALNGPVSDMNFERGQPLTGNQTVGGYDGSINLSTANYIPGSTVGFTLVLELIKRY